PYMTGEDLNQRFDQSASRWVINFHDWTEERCQTYPQCFTIVEQTVKSQRLTRGRADTRKRWWQFGRMAVELYETIAPHKRVLACAEVSKFLAFSFVACNTIYSNKLLIFAFDDYGVFSILQSCFHQVWVDRFSSTLETRMSYGPSDCYENFPFPTPRHSLM